MLNLAKVRLHAELAVMFLQVNSMITKEFLVTLSAQMEEKPGQITRMTTLLAITRGYTPMALYLKVLSTKIN